MSKIRFNFKPFKKRSVFSSRVKIVEYEYILSIKKSLDLNLLVAEPVIASQIPFPFSLNSSIQPVDLSAWRDTTSQETEASNLLNVLSNFTQCVE